MFTPFDDLAAQLPLCRLRVGAADLITDETGAFALDLAGIARVSHDAATKEWVCHLTRCPDNWSEDDPRLDGLTFEHDRHAEIAVVVHEACSVAEARQAATGKGQPLFSNAALVAVDDQLWLMTILNWRARGLSYREIGDRLRMPIVSIRGLMSLARDLLAEDIADPFRLNLDGWPTSLLRDAAAAEH